MAASILTHTSNGAPPDYLTVTDAQRLWRISPKALQRKRAAGLLTDHHSQRDTRTVLLEYRNLVEVLGEPVTGPVR